MAKKFRPEPALVKEILHVLNASGYPLSLGLIRIDILLHQLELEKVGMPAERERSDAPEMKTVLSWMERHRLVKSAKRIRHEFLAEQFWQGFPWRRPRERVYTPLVCEWDEQLSELFKAD